MLEAQQSLVADTSKLFVDGAANGRDLYSRLLDAPAPEASMDVCVDVFCIILPLFEIFALAFCRFVSFLFLPFVRHPGVEGFRFLLLQPALASVSVGSNVGSGLGHGAH